MAIWSTELAQREHTVISACETDKEKEIEKENENEIEKDKEIDVWV